MAHHDVDIHCATCREYLHSCMPNETDWTPEFCSNACRRQYHSKDKPVDAKKIKPGFYYVEAVGVVRVDEDSIIENGEVEAEWFDHGIVRELLLAPGFKKATAKQIRDHKAQVVDHYETTVDRLKHLLKTSKAVLEAYK